MYITQIFPIVLYRRATVPGDAHSPETAVDRDGSTGQGTDEWHHAGMCPWLNTATTW